MGQELWRSVRGYEGFYEISSQGRIRSIDRYASIANGNKRFVKGTYLRLRTNQNGYVIVNLCKNGLSKTLKVHRLVAEAFIGKPNNKCCIHHKNSNRTENNIDNLEWVNHSQNNLYAFQNGSGKRSSFIIDDCSGKAYKSIAQAAGDNGISYWKCRSMLNGYSVNTTCLRLVNLYGQKKAA